MIIMRKHLSRRHLLRGAGAVVNNVVIVGTAHTLIHSLPHALTRSQKAMCSV